MALRQKNKDSIFRDIRECIKNDISVIKQQLDENMCMLVLDLSRNPLSKDAILQTFTNMFGCLRSCLNEELPHYFGTTYDGEFAINPFRLQLLCTFEIYCIQACKLITKRITLNDSLLDSIAELLKLTHARKVYHLYKYPRCFKYLNSALPSLFPFYCDVEIARYQVNKYPWIGVVNIPSMDRIHRSHGPLMALRSSTSSLVDFITYLNGIQTSDNFFKGNLKALCSFCEAPIKNIDNFVILNCCKRLVCTICRHLNSWKEW